MSRKRIIYGMASVVKPLILPTPADIDEAYVEKKAKSLARHRSSTHARHFGGHKTESERATDAIRSRSTKCLVVGCKSPARSNELCFGHERASEAGRGRKSMMAYNKPVPGRCNLIVLGRTGKDRRAGIRCRGGSHYEDGRCSIHHHRTDPTEL